MCCPATHNQVGTDATCNNTASRHEVPSKCYKRAQNRKVVVATNLKPMKLAGIKSCGMVICASTEDKSTVELLQVPEGAAVGERLTFAGHDGPAATPGQMGKKNFLRKVGACCAWSRGAKWPLD